MLSSLGDSSLESWVVSNFKEWRTIARWLMSREVTPANVYWQTTGQPNELLAAKSIADVPATFEFIARVSPQLLDLLEQISCHSDRQRWHRMYEVIWRATQGQPHILSLSTDETVAQVLRMQKQIRRDCHKMKAFVRFKRIEGSTPESFVAWHRPDHNVVERVAPFFARRFSSMRWTILTPFISVSWDGRELSTGPAVPWNNVPDDEQLERLWKEYYRSTFNPARIKVEMMKREMPVRFWDSLPETSLIDEMLDDAPARVAHMIETSQTNSRSASLYIPENSSLNQLRDSLGGCRGCELCDNGTRPVPGEGPANSRLMIVGEQPGDQEERLGRPFVGPAGDVLAEALQMAGIDRSQIYITNVVKHFHHELRGKQRLHARPTARQEAACRPWLEAEISVLRPTVVVGLGTTALHALLGRHVRLSQVVNQVQRTWASERTLFAWHPAAILRTTGAIAAERRRQLSECLKLASELCRTLLARSDSLD
jgi:uracil-DNA glycosylase